MFKKIFLSIITFFGLLGLCVSTSNAKTFSHYQTKILANKKYGIYQKLTKKGISGYKTNTRILRYANYQSKKFRKVANKRYWYVIIDGHRGGWLNENAFAKNKISLAKKVSLVYNPYYNFNPKDALNYVTDEHGSAVSLEKIKVSQKSISSANPGLHRIEFSYKKAHAHLIVEVRNNKKEGYAKLTKKPKLGKTFSSWKIHYKTSGKWGKSFAPENKAHVLKSRGLKLKTVFYQPATLSRGYTANGALGPTPEGLAIYRKMAYLTMYFHTGYEHARLVSYNMNKIHNKYILQKLPWLKWKKFVSLARHIKTSPYLKLGHGQTLSATKHNLYVIANDHLLTRNAQSEEIMQISKKNLQIKKVWTFRIWHKNVRGARYIHNAVFINDHQFYCLYHRLGRHKFEYWLVTKVGDQWLAKEVGATKGDFMSNNSPVQGMAYNRHKRQFIIAFNDYLLFIKRNGRFVKDCHFHTGREFEGISVSGKKLYAELAQRPELLKGRLK